MCIVYIHVRRYFCVYNTILAYTVYLFNFPFQHFPYHRVQSKERFFQEDSIQCYIVFSVANWWISFPSFFFSLSMGIVDIFMTTVQTTSKKIYYLLFALTFVCLFYLQMVYRISNGIPFSFFNFFPSPRLPRKQKVILYLNTNRIFNFLQ